MKYFTLLLLGFVLLSCKMDITGDYIPDKSNNPFNYTKLNVFKLTGDKYLLKFEGDRNYVFEFDRVDNRLIRHVGNQIHLLEWTSKDTVKENFNNMIYYRIKK